MKITRRAHEQNIILKFFSCIEYVVNMGYFNQRFTELHNLHIVELKATLQNQTHTLLMKIINTIGLDV